MNATHTYPSKAVIYAALAGATVSHRVAGAAALKLRVRAQKLFARIMAAADAVAAQAGLPDAGDVLTRYLEETLQGNKGWGWVNADLARDALCVRRTAERVLDDAEEKIVLINARISYTPAIQ